MIRLSKEWLSKIKQDTGTKQIRAKRAPRGSIPKGSFIIELTYWDGKFKGELKPL